MDSIMNCILDYIPKGKESAISVNRLAGMVGVKNERTLRAYIAELRKNGAVICSSAVGYYIPASREELREYIDRMEKQARGTFRGIRSARDALRELEGQAVFNLE